MSNLYSVTKPDPAIRDAVGASVDASGIVPRMPAVFPDDMAPVVIARASDGRRELLMMRWGFPSPFSADRPVVTNVRNTRSSWWRPYLDQQFRCLVPATSFCEYDHRTGKAVPTWFALDDTRPLFFFAGIWRSWRGTRGTKKYPIDGNHMLFSFLTTEPNAEVGEVHEKAMPVLLLSEEERRTWMTAPVEEALTLQKPARDGALCLTQPLWFTDFLSTATYEQDLTEAKAGAIRLWARASDEPVGSGESEPK
jgi:putative SOS response-associated peptidase YedK